MIKLIIVFLFITLNTKAQKRDTIKIIMANSDTSCWTGNKISGLGMVYWQYGYAIRIKHYTIEDEGNPAICCLEYWVEKYYMDDSKNLLPSTVVVWQSIPANWTDTKPLPYLDITKFLNKLNE